MYCNNSVLFFKLIIIGRQTQTVYSIYVCTMGNIQGKLWGYQSTQMMVNNRMFVYEIFDAEVLIRNAEGVQRILFVRPRLLHEIDRQICAIFLKNFSFSMALFYTNLKFLHIIPNVKNIFRFQIDIVYFTHLVLSSDSVGIL